MFEIIRHNTAVPNNVAHANLISVSDIPQMYMFNYVYNNISYQYYLPVVDLAYIHVMYMLRARVLR